MVDKVEPARKNEKFDAEAVTKQLEGGHTALLEQALGQTPSLSERRDMLKVVQGLNASHRLEKPAEHLPMLIVEEETVGNWVRPSFQISLKRQEYKNFAVPEPIYVEKNDISRNFERQVVKTKH